MGLCGETSAIIRCLDEYARMCGPCDPQSARDGKKKSCTDIYLIFVSKAASFKGQLFAATSDPVITFYDGQRYLGNITR